MKSDSTIDRVDEADSRVRQYVAQMTRNPRLGLDDDIFQAGVNSLFAMRLILFLEQTFQIQIENEDLEWEHFRTVRSLGRLVERKLRAPAEGHDDGTH